MKAEINQCLRVKDPTKLEHQSIMALHRGDATPHQQRLALQYIVNKVARSQDLLYIPNDQDGTAFLNGRAFVGQNILKLINVPIGTYEIKEEGDNAN